MILSEGYNLGISECCVASEFQIPYVIGVRYNGACHLTFGKQIQHKGWIPLEGKYSQSSSRHRIDQISRTKLELRNNQI